MSSRLTSAKIQASVYINEIHIKMPVKKHQENKGFTLVELLVVIAIIAILSVTGYVALGGQTGKARDSRRQSDLAAIQNALEIYYINNDSRYPDDLNALLAREMPQVPQDPWSTVDLPFVYRYGVSANRREYELGTTLEGEDGDFQAYVIGNATTNLLPTGFDPVDASPGCTVTDGSTTCVPYFK